MDWRAQANEIRGRKSNVRYRELASMLEAAGFELRRSEGSHRTFCKPGCALVVSLKENPGQVKIGHVTEALRAVELYGDD
jgi:predicted RNA binding protein YcfA (HicA-like mRNA interferase family)